MEPSLRYARTSEGVTIAYTVTGEGPALIWLPPVPLSNVYGQWRVPRFRDAYERLGQHLRLVIYDGRGTGNSQRDVDDFSLEAMLRDLQAVVDHAGLETFALLGYYSSAVTAIAYAARFTDRVTRIVLFGGTMRLLDAMSPPESQALVTLIDRDWDLFVDSAAHAWLGWSVGEEGRLVAEAFRTATTPTLARVRIWPSSSTSSPVRRQAPRHRPLLQRHDRSDGVTATVASAASSSAAPNARRSRSGGPSRLCWRRAGSPASSFRMNPDPKAPGRLRRRSTPTLRGPMPWWCSQPATWRPARTATPGRTSPMRLGERDRSGTCAIGSAS